MSCCCPLICLDFHCRRALDFVSITVSIFFGADLFSGAVILSCRASSSRPYRAVAVSLSQRCHLLAIIVVPLQFLRRLIFVLINSGDFSELLVSLLRCPGVFLHVSLPISGSFSDLRLVFFNLWPSSFSPASFVHVLFCILSTVASLSSVSRTSHHGSAPFSLPSSCSRLQRRRISSLATEWFVLRLPSIVSSRRHLTNQI